MSKISNFRMWILLIQPSDSNVLNGHLTLYGKVILLCHKKTSIYHDHTLGLGSLKILFKTKFIIADFIYYFSREDWKCNRVNCEHIYQHGLRSHLFGRKAVKLIFSII